MRAVRALREAPTRLLCYCIGYCMGRGIAKTAAKRNAGRLQQERNDILRWKSRIPHYDSNSADLLSERVTVQTQPQFPFFQKLPPELRQLIYELALGGHTLALEFRDDWKRPHLQVQGKDVPEWLFALCKTCRLAYSESLPIIYTHNTFVATFPPAILFFPAFVAPHLFHSIRHLDLRFQIRDIYIPIGRKISPEDEETWEEMWENVVAGMTGLRSVWVQLRGYAPVLHGDIENGVLGAVEKGCVRKGVELFVEVDWDAEKGTGEREWGFRVERVRCGAPYSSMQPRSLESVRLVIPEIVSLLNSLE